MAERIKQEAIVDSGQHGLRLDQAAAELFPDFSRSRLQAWIRSGELRVDGSRARPRDRVSRGELLSLGAEPVEEVRWQGEAIDLDLVFEDDSIIVLNKAAGLVVHPAAGHPAGTLVNALLNHDPDLVNVPRAGIVHRLDKDTSGLMVVAKTLQAHNHLVAQLQARAVRREYAAVCIGAMTGGGTVAEAMGRHPRDRKKMAVLTVGGKPAVTHYRIAQRFAHHTHITVRLETGRTHQIRVHMSHLRYPLIGDPAYGGRPRIPKAATQELIDTLRQFPRQALHAQGLGLVHPRTEELLKWDVPLPEDMLGLLEVLRVHDRESPDDDAAY